MATRLDGPSLDQRCVYGYWFEGLLLHALQPRITAALAKELRAAGLDLELPLAPHYTAALRLECVRLIRQHLFKKKSEAKAMLELGRAAFEGFLRTPVGRGFDPQLRLLGPRSLMKKAGTLMSAATNYTTATATERGPFRWDLQLSGVDLHPTYYTGMALAGLEVCGAIGVHVEEGAREEDRLEIHCVWSPPAPRG